MSSDTRRQAGTPRYAKPKILLVDLPEGVARRLSSLGFNVQEGTFSRPYRVPATDKDAPVIFSKRLPNYYEQEIVIIDLSTCEPQPQQQEPIYGLKDTWYAECGSGSIDPRPIAMSFEAENGDRILNSGGLFVVFAEPRVERHFRLGKERQRKFDNWMFLSFLNPELLKVEAHRGMESNLKNSPNFLQTFFRKHQEGLTFTATLAPLAALTEEWGNFAFHPVAENKYGQAIAGVILAKKSRGRVLLLPHFRDKEQAVVDLFEGVLPEISPHLFPEFEGGRWTHRDEYEHPSILAKWAVQREVARRAKVELDRLQSEIEQERNKFNFLHGLLTKSGHDLVEDVRTALGFIGFKQVVLVDDAEATEANKQEDIQIHDNSPVLLLEIKGISALPREDDTQQVTKYVHRRAKQWNRLDVKGVCVVNHQRNLPAMERDHKNVFTDQQLQNALANETGLTTTWDLFLLIRGMQRWKWPAASVKNLFNEKGRLPRVPSHYVPVGTVTHFYPDPSVLSIAVTGDNLKVGDTVGYLLDDGFFEEQVTSLQVDHQPVQEVRPPEKVGHRTTRSKGVREGTLVYRVRKEVAAS
jgi:hypothetical protein